MLALTIASGLCAAWWMAPIGLVFWLIVLVVTYRDPALRMSNTVAGRTTLAYRFQSKFDRVEKVQTSLFLTFKSAPDKTRRLLKPIQDAVNDLVEQTYHVCQRFANVDNYITVQRAANKDLEGEIAIYELKLAGTTDDHLQKEYEEALGTLREQADHLKRMTKLLERFEAQLTTLTSTLERVQANAIRLQTMDEVTIRSEIPDLLKWIEVQSQELKGFEKQAG
jgi:hypothetical protein